MNSSMKRIAVIIPVLNEGKHINRCVDSLQAQSFPFEEMEILIVDGGSTDNTIKIAEHLSASFANIRLLHNPEMIQSVAFNLGVENSSAPIVIRLDAHASYDKEYIGKIVGHLESKDYGNVGGRWLIAPQSDSLIAKANAVANQMKFAIGGADFRVGKEKKLTDSVPFGGFRREVINRIGGMNPKLPRGEDNEYNARIRAAGYKILFDPEIIATYFARPTLLSFLKQMYANGVSIGILTNCYRQSLGLRHLVPVFFFLSIALLFIGGFFYRLLWSLLLIELMAYFCCSIIASIVEAKKWGWKLLCVLPWEVCLLHFLYGYGTMVGVFKRSYSTPNSANVFCRCQFQTYAKLRELIGRLKSRKSYMAESQVVIHWGG